ncbi:unnamed protein product [Owenia fusiformis]|uniref:Uncharacterized protein n=1 Tax=Owenia fusiformis TaxID=6347 RepID=A0A8S4NQD9_OWEFU|nr:unnamed protein product [Owenia fusiformis]
MIKDMETGVNICLLIAIFNYLATTVAEVNYSGDFNKQCYSRESESPGIYFPVIRRHWDCPEMLSEMGEEQDETEWPPPRFPPEDQFFEFTMNGLMPIQRMWYFSRAQEKNLGKSNNIDPHWTETSIKQLQSKTKSDEVISSYEVESDRLIKKTLEKFRDNIDEKHGIVIGSERPWLEAHLLNANAKHVTTLEYGSIKSDHSKISTLTPVELSKRFQEKALSQFDFGFTYSSLEHSGLGRYGDPLDPCGDLKTMACAWCIIKPGGLFFLNVPTSKDNSSHTFWNAHRVYGRERLKFMAANWNVVDKITYPTNNPDTDTVWVFQKP